MILVVGATGQLGGLIAQTLLDRGKPVRILVRDASSYDHLVKSGAEPVKADLKNPDSLRAACAGIDAVVTTANSTARGGADTLESVDRAGNRQLIDAAAAEGVRHFVFVSSIGAGPENPVPLLQAKGEAERRLRHSGMAWTILQPNMFMDKLPLMVVGGPALAGRPVTLVGEGRRRHSMVAMRDVAAYAVAALERQEAVGQTLLIGGPEPISWRDVVAAFEQELGRDVPVKTVPLGLPVPGMPDWLSQVLTALETYDSPLDIDALADAYGVMPTSLAEWARDVVVSSRERVPGP